eukprot:gene7997-9534_t
MSWALSSAVVSLDYATLASSSTGQYFAACGASSNTDSCSIYLSSDYGASWTINTDLPSGIYAVITSSSSGQRMATCSDNIGIYTSSDYGSNWALSPNSASAAASCSDGTNSPAMVASSSGQYMYTFTLFDGLYYSGDYGLTWTSSAGAPDNDYYYYAIASSPSGQYIAAATSKHIYFSQNFGVSYTKTLAPANDFYTGLVCNDAGAIIVSATNNMLRSTNLGITWVPFGDYSGGRIGYISSDSSNTNMIALDSGDDVVVTSNGGATWYIPSALVGSSFSPKCTATNSDGTIMAFGTDSNGIYIGKISYSSGGSSGDLSGGAIAGIVFGVLAGVAILAAVAWFFVMPLLIPKPPLAAAATADSL